MCECGIDRVVVSGRLLQEPELFELPSGDLVCSLRLACASGRRTPGGARKGEGNSLREGGGNWLDVIVLGSMAPRIARYLCPGRGILVLGSLQSERWEAGEGPEREAVCVLADRVCFIGPRPRDARLLIRRGRAKRDRFERITAIGERLSLELSRRA
jgi:single-strand DNA-binding protein